VRYTDFSFTIVTENIVQDTPLYVKLIKGKVSHILSEDAARRLFCVYDELEELFSRVGFTHTISYLAVQDDETLVFITIKKKYSNNGRQVVGAIWEMEINNNVTKKYITFEIDRKTLWRINQYSKVLSNALFYWWWHSNEIELRYTRTSSYQLLSLKDTCKVALLKNATEGCFISKEILSLYPPMIQQFLQGWPGMYMIKHGHDLPRTEPRDNGKDSDFL
jgi:hypothetical protein